MSKEYEYYMKSFDWGVLSSVITVVFIIVILVFEEQLTEAPTYVKILIALGWLVPTLFCLFKSMTEEM